MKLILQLALRNMIRQKRRNLLLGLAIAFGIMVMTIATSFSKGITDNLLNRIIVYVAGHTKVSMIEYGRVMSPIIRDKDRAFKIIQNNISGLKNIEEDIGTFCRAVGNAKGDYAMIVGVTFDDNFKNYAQIIKGDYDHFSNSEWVNPILLSEQKAKSLNVDIGDQVRVRLSSVNGQKQTAILTVGAVMKSQNMFMDWAIYVPVKQLKIILGYKPHETGALKLTLENPKNAVAVADQLHTLFQPEKAWIETISLKGTPIALVALNVDTKNNNDGLKSLKGAVISQTFSQKHNIKIGDKLHFFYTPKYKENPVRLSVKIADIKTPKKGVSSNAIFLDNTTFFRLYNYHLPKNKGTLTEYINLAKTDPIWSTIAPEWRLLKRTHTTKEFEKKFKGLMKNKMYQPTADISSMYESASQIVKMEDVFNMVTLIAASIIFFIIMIGVLNSLRMTIRERTKEIGTMRAIGIQKKLVRRLFLTETILLTIASWGVGLAVAFAMMKGLSLIQFGHDNPLNMLMRDRRLYFIPTISQMLLNLAIVLIFAVITAFFPAKKAANLSPAEALRK